MSKNKSVAILWVFVVALTLVVASVAAYKIWPMLNPEIAETAILDPECDLRAGPCTVEFNDGRSVRFAIAPDDIPVVQPLEFDVLTSGIDASSVEVDFQGVDMNMGYNRSQLKSEGEGRFSGTGMLPVCVRYAMEWEAKVLLHTNGGILAAPFRFITVTPGMEPPNSGQSPSN